jgi:hypothetical protein
VLLQAKAPRPMRASRLICRAFARVRIRQRRRAFLAWQYLLEYQHVFSSPELTVGLIFWSLQDPAETLEKVTAIIATQLGTEPEKVSFNLRTSQPVWTPAGKAPPKFPSRAIRHAAG